VRRLLIFGAAGVAVLAVGIAIAVAATSGGGGSAKTAGGQAVSAERIGGAGNVLVDSSNHALYTNDQEHGMALCTGACLSFWTPLTVAKAPQSGSLPGKLALAKRPDGKSQVTYDGKLLYTFAEDGAGQVSGDGFTDAFGDRTFSWHVAHPTATRMPAAPPAPAPAYPGY